MIHRLLPVLAGALLVAGCGATPPQVGFAAGPAEVVAGPTQYCDLEFTECTNDPAAPVELAVPPGTPLRVTVPAEIAQTPWQLVFTYRDANLAQTAGRSPVFGAGERSDYILALPTPTARLLIAQVQQYGPPPQLSAQTGEVEFPIRATWVLTVTA